MGQVSYYACDCCGQKANPKKVAKVVISKKSWKKNVELDACPDCVKKLKNGDLAPKKTQSRQSEHEIDPNDLTADDEFVMEKQAQHREQRFDTVSPLDTNVDEQGNVHCPHMNKTRVTFRGKIPYQQCRDCGIVMKVTKREGVSLSRGDDVRLNADKSRIEKLES